MSTPPAEPSTREIHDRLTRAIGLDPAAHGSAALTRVVARRMRSLGLSTTEEYVRRLDADRDELQTLIEDVVVGESWFFRQPRAFEVLAAHATATLDVREAGDYRVLSFPCAGGEEPYSIAIALLEAGLPSDRIEIDAADVSRRALEHARSGRYRLRSLREVAPPRRSRYFTAEGDMFSLIDEVRRLVALHHTNGVTISTDTFHGPYDAVFCRNLLIYLVPEARRTMWRRIEKLLSPDGLLFLGHADPPEDVGKPFKRLDVEGSFAYRRSATGSTLEPRLDTATLRRPSPKLKPKPVAGDAPKPPGRGSIGTRPAALPAAGPQLEAAELLAGAGRLDEALAVCEAFLKRRGPSPHGLHVLGMIHQAAGRTEAARAALERAVYLDRDHSESLLALALLARTRGDHDAAARYESRAQRAHTRTST